MPPFAHLGVNLELLGAARMLRDDDFGPELIAVLHDPVNPSADLSIGDLVGEGFRRLFHHWKYRVDGNCSGLPSKALISGTARQLSFQCAKNKTRSGPITVSS